MSTTGCLVTSTPQFKPQEHTRPFLIASTALPSVGTVVVVNTESPGAVPFISDVISQDDQADSMGPFMNVYARVFIDYGFTQPESGWPYRLEYASKTFIGPGYLDQTAERKVTVTWFAGDDPSSSLSPGCHTATLVASHIFDPNDGCPACVDDYTMITWPVLRCSSQSDCANLPVSGMGACPAQLNSGTSNTFEQFRAMNPSPSCPEQVDGGAP